MQILFRGKTGSDSCHSISPFIKNNLFLIAKKKKQAWLEREYILSGILKMQYPAETPVKIC